MDHSTSFRLPCPSPTPRACPNSCPTSQWCHPTILSPVLPFSSCLQSPPASGSFLMSQLFVYQVAKVLKLQLQHHGHVQMKWCVQDHAQTGPEGTNKLHYQVAQMLSWLLLHSCFLLSPHLGCCSNSHNLFSEEEKNSEDGSFYHNMFQKLPLQSSVPLKGGEEKSQWAEFSTVLLVVYCN